MSSPTGPPPDLRSARHAQWPVAVGVKGGQFSGDVDGVGAHCRDDVGQGLAITALAQRGDGQAWYSIIHR
jgi:hypothetical protein